MNADLAMHGKNMYGFQLQVDVGHNKRVQGLALLYNLNWDRFFKDTLEANNYETCVQVVSSSFARLTMIRSSFLDFEQSLISGLVHRIC